MLSELQELFPCNADNVFIAWIQISTKNNIYGSHTLSKTAIRFSSDFHKAQISMNFTKITLKFFFVIMDGNHFGFRKENNS